MVLEMEENGELEEGEACYDNGNFDPDTDFSYIDERIHDLLGHFQKDFEGGVSADNLGAKFGGYGSFLPTYERSPSVWSHPKTLQSNQSISRSPNNFILEAASQVVKASSNTPLSRLGTVSSSDHPSHNPKAISVKKSSYLPSVQVAEKNALKDETPSRSANQTDQRPLKFRIKMSSDNLAQKNAIYSGLGLDVSPSSSSGKSSEESGGRPPVSRETVDESPTNIIKVMTSFPISGDVKVSPLHDSLLCLIREEKFVKAGKQENSFKGVQEKSTVLVDKSGPKQRDGKMLKEKAKSSGKSKRQTEIKHANGAYEENDVTIGENLTSDKETTIGKDILHNGSKPSPITNAECDAGGSVKVISRESKVHKEVNNDEMKDGLFSSKLPKEESFESVYGQDCGKREKQMSMGSFAEMLSEQRVTNSFKDAPADLRDDSKCKGKKISATFKSYSDVSKSEDDLDMQRKNIGQKNTLNEDDERNLPCKREKQSFEDKNKLKGTKENLGIERGAEPEDKNINRGVGPCSSKTEKPKSRKNSKVGDNNSDLFCGRDLELTDNRLDTRERNTAERPKAAKLGNFEVDKKAFLDKPKETVSSKKVDDRVSLKGAPGVYPPVMVNGIASQMAPAAATVLIEEDWVCCDRCQTWRLLPFGMKPEQLPEKWLCSMLNWLPGMNRCDFSEEETAKALRALYLVPVSENQNNVQNHANAVDFQRLDQDNLNSTSQALASRGKKRHGLKEISNLGISDSPQILNPATNQPHEPVKSRSLNDTNQSPLDSNLMKKSSPQYISKPCNLVLEKDTVKHKEKHANGGNSKEIRNKSKRDADQYAVEASKKSKTEGMYNAAKHQDSDADLVRGGLSSSTKGTVKGLKNGKYLSKDAKFEAEGAQISIKKLEDKGRFSSNGASLDPRTCVGSDRSMKKRKLKDRQENQTHIDTFDNYAYNDKLHKEESSESGFRKEKKYGVSKADGKESCINSGNDKLDRKDRRVSPIILTGIKSHQFDGVGKDGIVDKDQPPRKRSKKLASQQALDGVYSLKRDLGSRHVSMAATSSSSKVSSSHKGRGNFEEAKGSPVESVSSSPLRTSNFDKLPSIAGDGLKKDAAADGGFPSVSNSKRPLAMDANGESNQHGTLRKEKIYSNVPFESHKFSTRQYQNGDASHDSSAKDKLSFEVGKSHLIGSSADIVDQHGVGHCYDEVHVEKNHHEEAFSQQKSYKVDSILQSKDRDKILTSDLERGKTKVADPVSEYSQKNQKYDSKVDPNHPAPSPGKAADVKHSSVKMLSIKTVKVEKNHSRKHYTSQGSNQLRRRENDGARYTMNGKISEGCPETTESKSSKSKFSSDSESGVKREALPVLGSEGAGTLNAPPVDTSINDRGPKLKQSGSASNKVRVTHGSMHLSPDRRGAMDVNASSPTRKTSDLTATGTLQEAKELRDYADRLKSSGFAFESSEAYFQAALKFLHGAALLEACGSENGRHGEITQMQIYTTTAKLCHLCAQEFERRQEMAAAALAYKCMEVAYMRVVYCKHSSTNRDLPELQATLHMIPQGESPSSSASDVDNLNTQVTGEKATLPRGASHVSGNHVIVSQSRTSFVRLLDFIQDVNFAMEASRKSQNAFTAANATLEQAHKKDCIASIRRVIDFSFQDIEELIRLVQLARESINRSGFGGATD